MKLSSRARCVDSFGGEALRRYDHVIGCPCLCLVRSDDISVAPLAQIRGNTYLLLGLELTVRCDARNRQDSSIDEAELA